MPSILITILSWVSFWINYDASAARVALGRRGSDRLQHVPMCVYALVYFFLTLKLVMRDETWLHTLQEFGYETLDDLIQRLNQLNTN